MKLIDKVKKAVPLASDPEPQSNITAGDFDEIDPSGDGDDNGRDSEGSSSPDGNEEQSGSDDGESSDGTNESSSESPDADSPGSEAADGQNQSSDDDGDRSDSSGDESAEAGEESADGTNESSDDAGDHDGEESGESGDSDGESGQRKQQSLFDYEDPDDWSDPSGDDSGNNDSEGNEDESGEGSGEDGQGNREDDAGDSEGDAPDENETGESGTDGSQEDGEETPGENGDESGESGDSSAGEDGDQETDGDVEDSPGDGTGSDGEADDDSDSDGTEGDGVGDTAGDEPGEDTEDGESEGANDDGEGSDDGTKEIEPDNNSPTQPGTGEDPYEPHPELAEDEQNQIQQEQRDLEEEIRQAQEELEEFAEALSDGAGGGGIGEVQFNIDPEGTTHSERWDDAVANRKRTARLLKKHLERSRRDKWKRGRTKGSLDSKRLHAVPSKRLDVMKRRDPGNKKKYSVIIVLDRSGSMGGEKIDIAESAIARYALAMEDLGIEVCVMDMYQNTARVISPFGVDIEMAKGDLMSNETGGGTPLSDAVEIARKRMQNSNEFPLMISVTDGQPRDPDRYHEELNKSHMPVMGITINPRAKLADGGPRTGPQDQYYDIHTYVNSQSELEEQLEKMTMQIPF
jgi:Mg-chelatase subunit ChlD